MDLISEINFASSASLASENVNNGVNNDASSPTGKNNHSFLNIDHLTNCSSTGDIQQLVGGISIPPTSKQDITGIQQNPSAVCDSASFTNFLMCPDIGSQFCSSATQNSFNAYISNPPDKTNSGLNFGTSPFQTNTSANNLYNNVSCIPTSAKFEFNTPSFDFNAYNPASAWAPLDMYSNSNMAASYQCQRNISASALSACSPAKFAATYPSINVNGFYYPTTYATPYTRYSRNLLSKSENSIEES